MTEGAQTGYAVISELAASRLFGDYLRAFPTMSRDAGDMLRVAVQIGVVDEYQEILRRALEAKRPVRDEQWHELCALVSWPRSLPEWDRGPIGEMKLLSNPRATPDWPDTVRGCRFGFQHPEIAWPDDDGAVAMLQRLRYAVVAWLRASFG